MHSFNDLHDFHDFKYPDFSLDIQRIGSNNATPLLGTGLPFLHQIDRQDQSIDNQFGWSLASKNQSPLLLLDESAYGPSEFQSNRIGLSTCMRISSHGAKHGLGFQVCCEAKEAWPAVTVQLPGDDFSFVSPDSSSVNQLSQVSTSILPVITGSHKRPEEEKDRSYSLSALTGHKYWDDGDFQLRPLSDVPLSSADSDDHCFSTGLSRLLSSLTDSDSSSLSTLDSGSSLPGLVADINMFRDINSSGGVCVRPQDLVRSDEEQTSEMCETETREGLHMPVVSEQHTLTSPVEDLRCPDLGPAPGQPLNAPNLSQVEHMLPNGSLYAYKPVATLPLQSFAPSVGAFSATPSFSHFPRVSDGTGSLQIFSDSSLAAEVEKLRNVLSDRTNIAGNNMSRARSSVNVLNVHNDTQIPFDVALTNVHEGVSAESVAQKTRFYIMSHPGERLSDELLFTFAGRLSDQGEPIQGYRCYVSGCEKTTKRKDHMGDHIRTHLGEKPFQCSIWYVEYT